MKSAWDLWMETDESRLLAAAASSSVATEQKASRTFHALGRENKNERGLKLKGGAVGGVDWGPDLGAQLHRDSHLPTTRLLFVSGTSIGIVLSFDRSIPELLQCRNKTTLTFNVEQQVRLLSQEHRQHLKGEVTFTKMVRRLARAP